MIKTRIIKLSLPIWRGSNEGDARPSKLIFRRAKVFALAQLALAGCAPHCETCSCGAPKLVPPSYKASKRLKKKKPHTCGFDKKRRFARLFAHKR